jgi:hypothetical protein
MNKGIQFTRDEQLTSLEQSVFSQIRSVLPVVEIPRVMNEPVIQEINLETAIQELLELEKLNFSHQEYQQ